MIDALNLLLLKKYETTPFTDASGEFINHWLKAGHNYERLQRECEKIWDHYSNDPNYDAERAFRVLGQRFIEVCHQEVQLIPIDNKTVNSSL